MFRLLAAVPILTVLLTGMAAGQHAAGPETIEVRTGSLTLHALLWRPQGRGPFPAILFNHGSGRTHEELKRLGPYEDQAQILGPVFARHGYVFLFLFRPGVGLSSSQGASAIELMNGEFASHGQDARNALQLRLLETREMSAAASGLAYLRGLGDVNPRRIALVGHSFGASLTLLQAAKVSDPRALVIFSNAGLSWDRSQELRTRLLDAMANVQAPVFFIHAANDYSVNPGKALDARLAQLGKPHRLKIYPPIGSTPEEGHSFVFLGVSIWERDVFAFLDENVK